MYLLFFEACTNIRRNAQSSSLFEPGVEDPQRFGSTYSDSGVRKLTKLPNKKDFCTLLRVRQSCFPATRPSKLLDGYQGHPPFLPVAWDRPAATEPGSETVYTFIQSTFVDSCRQCKMRLKPENRKDPLTMIYVT